MRVNYKWLLVSLAAIVLIGATTVTYKQNQVKEVHLNNQIEQLKEQSKARSEADKQKLQKRELELQQQVRELNEKLQSKAAEKARLAAVEAAKTPVVSKVVQSIVPTAQAATGDAKAFIYARESGNNPGAINAGSGACGLGQALPCSKMPCSLSDYACQDNFFTQYMLNRYGSWENARAFWLSHRWW